MEEIAKKKKIKKGKKVVFPWLETYKVNYMKNFPDDSEDLLQSLLNNINLEVKAVSTRQNRKRLKALFETVQGLFLQFWWKIQWKENEMWRKYKKKNYWKTFNCDFGTKCVVRLLYFIVEIGMILSKGASDSNWISRTLHAVHILSDYNIVYSSLLLVHKLKTKYHLSFCAILKSVLITKFQKCILDPLVYIKIMILFRTLKKYLKDADEKREIQSAALKFQAPTNLIPWMTSFNLDARIVKKQNIAQQLFKKSSRDLVQKLRLIVADFDSLSNEKSEDTKGIAENILQVDLNEKNLKLNPSKNLKIKKSISSKMKHKSKKEVKKEIKRKSETVVNLDETHSLAINEKCNKSVNLGFTLTSPTTINGTSLNLDDTYSLTFHKACNKNANLSLQPSSQKLDTLLKTKKKIISPKMKHKSPKIISSKMMKHKSKNKITSSKMKKHKSQRKIKKERKRKSGTAVNLDETHSLVINEKCNKSVNLGLSPSSPTTINGTSLNLDDTNSLTFHKACNKNANLSLQPSSQKLDTLLKIKKKIISSKTMKHKSKNKNFSSKMKKHKSKRKIKKKRKSGTAVNLDETHSLVINEKCNKSVNLGLSPSSPTTINGTSLNLDDTNSLTFHKACNKNANLSLQPSSQKLDTLLKIKKKIISPKMKHKSTKIISSKMMKHKSKNKNFSSKMKKHKSKRKIKKKRKSGTAVNLDETHSLVINEKCNKSVNLGLSPSSPTTINGTSLNLEDTNSLAFHEAYNENVNLNLKPSSQKLDTLLCNKLNVEDCRLPLSSEKSEAIPENNISFAKTKRKTFSLCKKGKTQKMSRKKMKLFNNDEFESSRKLVEMHPNNEVVLDVNKSTKISSLRISANMNSTHDVNILQTPLNFPKEKISHNKTELNIFSGSEVCKKSCGKTLAIVKEQVYSLDDDNNSTPYNADSAPLFDSMSDRSADMGNSFEAGINSSTQVHSNLNCSFSENSLEAPILNKKISVSEGTCGRNENDANTAYDDTIDHVVNQTATHLLHDLNVINPDSQITADNLDLCRDDSVFTREEHFNFENNATTHEQLCNSFNSVTNWISNINSDSVAQNVPTERKSYIGRESVGFSENENFNKTETMCKNTEKVSAKDQRECMLHQSSNSTCDKNTFAIDCSFVNDALDHIQSETRSENSSIQLIINLNFKKPSDSLLLQHEHHAGNSKLTTNSSSPDASANSSDHFNISQSTGSSSQVMPQYNGYHSPAHEVNHSRNDDHYTGNDFSRGQQANNFTSSKSCSLSGKTYRNSATDFCSDDNCDISVRTMGVISDKEDTDNSFKKALGGLSLPKSGKKTKDLGSNNHSRKRIVSISSFEYYSTPEKCNLNYDKGSNLKTPLIPKCRASSFKKTKIVRRKANKTVGIEKVLKPSAYNLRSRKGIPTPSKLDDYVF